jgi:hypothetical protein
LILLLTASLWLGGNAGKALAAVEITGVPFVQQETGFCGPAALLAVMTFYQVPDDQQVIANAVYNPKLQGSLITDLERYAVEKGFATRSAQGTMEDIRGFIRESRPVIVLVDTGFWVLSRPHYLVMTGFNDHGFIAHTGQQASCPFSEATFQRIWKRKGSTYLLIWR